MAAEFKEKTGPDMLNVLQKHVKNGHFIGSEVSWCVYVSVCMSVTGAGMSKHTHPNFEAYTSYKFLNKFLIIWKHIATVLNDRIDQL